MILLKGFDEAVKRKGIKLKNVSEMMGLEYSALYRKRTGERKFSLDDVVKLAGILDCSIQELVYGFDANPDENQSKSLSGGFRHEEKANISKTQV